MAYFKCPKCGKNLTPMWHNGVRVHGHDLSACEYEIPSAELYAKSKKARSATACKQRLRESFRLATESNTVWSAFVDPQDIISLIGGSFIHDEQHRFGKYTPPKGLNNAPNG
jgi:hypothetical protein